MIKNNLENDDLEIVSLGRKHGADRYIKEFALMFDIKYSEFIPYHDRWNNFCVEKPFLFGKDFSAKYYFMVYNRFVKYCDKIMIFDTEEDGDPVVNEVIKITKKKNKEMSVLTP